MVASCAGAVSSLGITEAVGMVGDRGGEAKGRGELFFLVLTCTVLRANKQRAIIKWSRYVLFYFCCTAVTYSKSLFWYLLKLKKKQKTTPQRNQNSRKVIFCMKIILSKLLFCRHVDINLNFDRKLSKLTTSDVAHSN